MEVQLQEETAAKLFELKEEVVEKDCKAQLKEDGELKDIDVQSNFSFDSSDSDSTTRSSDNEEDTADAAKCTADNDDEEEGEINSADDGEEAIGQEEEEDVVALGPLKTKNEVERLPEVASFDMSLLPSNAEFALVGTVSSCVDAQIVVEACESGEEIVLDSETVLFTLSSTDSSPDSMQPLGRIWDVFGPVSQPFYSVRFNSRDDAQTAFQTQIRGQKVFYVPDLKLSVSNVVMTKPLKQLKGTDASNIYDEEVGIDEMEFSDDEKEQEFKKNLKRKKKHNNDSQDAPSRHQDGKRQKQQVNRGQTSQYQDQPKSSYASNHHQENYNQKASTNLSSINNRSFIVTAQPIAELPYPEFNARQVNRHSTQVLTVPQTNPYLLQPSPPVPTSLPVAAQFTGPASIQQQQQEQMTKLASLLKSFQYR